MFLAREAEETKRKRFEVNSCICFFMLFWLFFSVDECNRKERAENKHGWLSRRNDEIITVVAMTTRTYFAHTLPAHFHSLFAHFLHTKFLIENSVCISCLSCVFVFLFSPKMKTMTMSMIEWKNRVNEKKSTRKESTTSEYHQMIFHMHAMFSHRRRPEKQNAERINTFYGVVFFLAFLFILFIFKRHRCCCRLFSGSTQTKISISFCLVEEKHPTRKMTSNILTDCTLIFARSKRAHKYFG